MYFPSNTPITKKVCKQLNIILQSWKKHQNTKRAANAFDARRKAHRKVGLGAGYLEQHDESSPLSKLGASIRISGTVRTLALRLHSQHTQGIQPPTSRTTCIRVVNPLTCKVWIYDSFTVK